MEEKIQEPDCFKPRLQGNNIKTGHQDTPGWKAMLHIKLHTDNPWLSLCPTSSCSLKEKINSSKKIKRTCRTHQKYRLK